MIGEKLRKVKDVLVERLSEKELLFADYIDISKELLLYNKITFDIDNDKTIIANMLLSKEFMPKLPGREYHGLEFVYVGLDHLKLSSTANNDINNYYILEKSAKSHLSKVIGYEPVLKSDFEDKIRTYLSKEIGLSNYYPSEIINSTTSRIACSLIIENNESFPKVFDIFDDNSIVDDISEQGVVSMEKYDIMQEASNNIVEAIPEIKIGKYYLIDLLTEIKRL